MSTKRRAENLNPTPESAISFRGCPRHLPGLLSRADSEEHDSHSLHCHTLSKRGPPPDEFTIQKVPELPSRRYEASVFRFLLRHSAESSVVETHSFYLPAGFKAVPGDLPSLLSKSEWAGGYPSVCRVNRPRAILLHHCVLLAGIDPALPP